MAVRIEVGPNIRRYVEGCDDYGGLMIEDGAGKTVRALCRRAGIPADMMFSVLVNHRPADPTRVVRDGDTIQVLLVLGGG